MGEYEPEDSRNVTLNPSPLPGEPPRTGPREGEAREQAEKGERPVKQENLAQEATGGNLPDAEQAAGGYDQDEG